MPEELSKNAGRHWDERKHGTLDLYIDGALRASVDYFAGSAIIFPHSGKDGRKIVAPWSKDIFGIVEASIGVERVTEIHYPPVERSDWRNLAEGRTKEVRRKLYGGQREFDYFIESASIRLNSRGDSGGQKRTRKPRLRAASAKALDALLLARRAAKRGQGKAKAISLLQEARGCLEGIPAGKVLIFETEALAEIKMALASVHAGKCLREPLSEDEATKLSNVIAGIEPPF